MENVSGEKLKESGWISTRISGEYIGALNDLARIPMDSITSCDVSSIISHSISFNISPAVSS